MCDFENDFFTSPFISHQLDEINRITLPKYIISFSSWRKSKNSLDFTPARFEPYRRKANGSRDEFIAARCLSYREGSLEFSDRSQRRNSSFARDLSARLSSAANVRKLGSRCTFFFVFHPPPSLSLSLFLSVHFQWRISMKGRGCRRCRWLNGINFATEKKRLPRRNLNQAKVCFRYVKHRCAKRDRSTRVHVRFSLQLFITGFSCRAYQYSRRLTNLSPNNFEIERN